MRFNTEEIKIIRNALVVALQHDEELGETDDIMEVVNIVKRIDDENEENKVD